ncbi:hypothetical protein AKJ16_DCAP01626 [Drosera capensis]
MNLPLTRGWDAVPQVASTRPIRFAEIGRNATNRGLHLGMVTYYRRTSKHVQRELLDSSGVMKLKQEWTFD